jgi:Tol biopolymer transport system component
MYVQSRPRSGRLSRLGLVCAAIVAIAGVTPSAAAIPSSGPPGPVCGNGEPPSWVTSAHSPNDGVPDPLGRIVFGLSAGIDVMGQLVTLFAIDPDGSDLVQLLDCKVARPRFSPDGTRLAFGIAMDDGSHQVATMDADGSDLRLLTSTPGYAGLPDWSPDGSWLIYSYEPNHCFDDSCDIPGGFHLSLWRMAADGSDARLIGDPNRASDAAPDVPTIFQDAEARLSPDGTEAVFTRIDGPDFIYQPMIRDLTTGAERKVTSNEREPEHPDWSRDGKWIIYNTGHPVGSTDLFEQIERVPADDATATPEVLYPGGGHYGYKPAYSPDGSRIVFVCENDICLMDADGSNVTKLVVHVPGSDLNHVAWGITPAR